MPECPIQISETKVGEGKKWRIEPPGYASEHGCVVRMYLGSSEVTGTGDYEGLHVDGYAQNGGFQINREPQPGEHTAVTFFVDCPNPKCTTLKVLPLSGGPVDESFSKFLKQAAAIAAVVVVVMAGVAAAVLIGVVIGLAIK